MLKPLFALFFALLSLSASGQVIDAESYIKQNGYKKKTTAGFGVFYTTLKKVKADEMPPFMESVKTMPRTEEALNMCQQQSIGVQRQFDSAGRKDLQVRKSVGYGGPQDGKFGCIFFIESQGYVAATQVFFLKTVVRGETYDAYTVIVSH